MLTWSVAQAQGSRVKRWALRHQSRRAGAHESARSFRDLRHPARGARRVQARASKAVEPKSFSPEQIFFQNTWHRRNDDFISAMF
jgi:hypothetical protein